MNEVVDGQYQKYTGMPGSYIREHFFGKYPELLKLVENYSDEKLEKLPANSISTGAFNGSALTPTAARAWRPASPRISCNRSLAPLATFG